jgi:putative membrane protein insertion efficiency factor
MIGKLANLVRSVLIFVVILPVRFYQIVIGPLLPKMCNFHPSCSEYFILAVKKHGPFVGACKGVWRICRCNPWSRGGYDPP